MKTKHKIVFFIFLLLMIFIASIGNSQIYQGEKIRRVPSVGYGTDTINVYKADNPNTNGGAGFLSISGYDTTIFFTDSTGFGKIYNSSNILILSDTLISGNDTLVVSMHGSSSINDSISVHRTAINNLNDSITNHTMSINNLNDSITNHTMSINNLNDSISDHTMSINNLNDSISDHTTRINNLNASNIFVDTIGNPTFHQMQEWINNIQSAGYISGGVISDAGSGAIDITSGTGFIKISNSAIAETKSFDFDAITNLSMTDHYTNYIYVDYNSGNITVNSETSQTANSRTKFYLGKVFREGNDLHILQAGLNITEPMKRIQSRINATNGQIERATGIILSGGLFRTIQVTAGSLYAGFTQITTTSKNTYTGDTFEYYYLLNGTWTESNQTKIDSLQYNNTSTPGAEVLATLTAGRFGVHWVYYDIDGHILVVYGIGNYNKLSDAEAAQPRSINYGHIADMSVLIGKIIIAKSAGTFSEVTSAYKATFIPSVVTNHSDLAGLSSDDHTQYILADGTRSLTSSWDAGSFEVRAQTFQADIATGTSPMTIASTTKVSNLNVDLLDGINSTAFAILAGQASGQTLNGGTQASESLLLKSTANATKGYIQLGTSEKIFTGGETSNANASTGSITIQMGAGSSSEPLSIKSTDINHGITSIVETDTYCDFTMLNSSTGGVRIGGFTENIVAMELEGTATNANSSVSTAALAPIVHRAWIKSGTGQTAVGSTENAICWASGTNTRTIMRGDGDMRNDYATTFGLYDEYNDVKLCRDLQLFIGTKKIAGYDLITLQEIGVLDNETPSFVSSHGLTKLTLGAIHQTNEKISEIDSKMSKFDNEINSLKKDDNILSIWKLAKKIQEQDEKIRQLQKELLTKPTDRGWSYEYIVDENCDEAKLLEIMRFVKFTFKLNQTEYEQLSTNTKTIVKSRE